jgi:hypothetical protein
VDGSFAIYPLPIDNTANPIGKQMLKAIENIFNVAMLFYTTGAVLSFVFGSSDGTVRDEGWTAPQN